MHHCRLLTVVLVVRRTQRGGFHLVGPGEALRLRWDHVEEIEQLVEPMTRDADQHEVMQGLPTWQGKQCPKATAAARGEHGAGREHVQGRLPREEGQILPTLVII